MVKYGVRINIIGEVLDDISAMKRIDRVGAIFMFGISYGSEILVCYLYMFTYHFM